MPTNKYKFHGTETHSWGEERVIISCNVTYLKIFKGDRDTRPWLLAEEQRNLRRGGKQREKTEKATVAKEHKCQVISYLLRRFRVAIWVPGKFRVMRRRSV